MKVIKNEKGYSLVEMVIVIVILSVIGVVVATPMIETGFGWQQISSRKDVLQLARLGMDKMVRELRNTQRIAGNSPNITNNATATCISFTTVENQNFTFNLNGTILEECRGCDCDAVAGQNALAVNVTGFTITCYDADNTAVTCNTVTSLRRVLLQISVMENGEVTNLDSEVTLRNLEGV